MQATTNGAAGDNGGRCVYCRDKAATTDKRPRRAAEADVLRARGFDVRGTLGQGRYCKVRLADDRRPGARHGAQVAVKVIDTGAVTADFLRKFLPREVANWAPLRHVNVVRMHDCFEASGRVFLVLELAPGGDLLTRVQQTGAADEATARDWLRQLVAGVAHLHARAVAHRDLKLENVLVGADGRLKITDLGFSRSVGDELATTYCGSKAYSAPEILAGQPYDALKADVWALGVIGFVIVTNRMPFNERQGNDAIIGNQRARAYRLPGRLSAAGAQVRRLRSWPTTRRFQFIDHLLTFDSRHRPHIGQVQRSAWLQRSTAAHFAATQV